MSKTRFSIAFLLCSGFLWSQHQDTVKLREVPVVDYEIQADKSFKEERMPADSLVLSSRQNLGEALRQSTGIFVKSYGGNGVATLSLRGTGASHTKVYWNNLDISSPSLALADFSTIPLAAFDEMNLQYGFASLSDGSGALGGSLRLSNQPRFGKPAQLSLSQTAASFDRYQSQARLSYGKENIRFQTRAYYYTAQNDFSYPDITERGRPEKQMRNNSLEQMGLLQNIFWRLDSRKLLSFKAWGNSTTRKLPPPITGNLDNFDRLEDRSISGIIEYRQSNRKAKLLINSGVNTAENIFTNGTDSSSNNNRFLSWQNNLRYQYQFSSKLSMESGAHYRLERARSGAFAQPVQRHQSSVFTSWDWQWATRWASHLLLRQSLFNREWSPLIGSAGVTYQSSPEGLIRLNAAHNFRFPSLNDLYWTPGGNPELQPEKSWSLESGYEHEFGKPSGRYRGRASLTLFYNIVDNWILWMPVGNLWSPQNVRKVENAGIEISAKGNWKIGPLTLSHQLDYSYTRSVTVKIYEGNSRALNNQLPYVPFQKGSLGLGLKFKNWELRYTQSASSRFYTNADNQIYMPAYTTADLSIRHGDLLPGLPNRLSVALGIHNIYNRAYQILPYRPEMGINFSTKIAYQLDL